MTDKISVAVCGYGHWGRNYVRNFNDIRHSRVSWCCDLNAKSLAAVKEQHPYVQTTSRLEDILKDPQTKAVVISTNAVTHYEITKSCLEAGKDVLVEKPLTLNVEEAERLMRLAKEKNCILMVGHTFLYNPAVWKAKELMDRGELGQIYYLKAVRSHMGLIREDVNVTWDLATHDISILNYLLGMAPIRVQAFGVRFLSQERDDAAFIILQYGQELLAHVHVSWADSNKQRLVEAVGSKGRIIFDDLNTQEPIRVFQRGISLDHDVSNFGEYKYLFRDGDIISPSIKMQEPLRVQCEHFLDCVGKRQKPLTDAENGLSVVKTMCQIENALKQTRREWVDV